MERLTAPLSLVILAWLPLTACMSLDVQSKAMAALAGMDADEYFRKPAQIALAEAAAEGNIPRMREALANGADVNAVGRDGMTPLIWAAVKQNLEGFRFLLEHGADPNTVTELPESFQAERAYIIGLAFDLSDPRYMKLLLEHGADPDTIVSADSNTTLLFNPLLDRSLKQIKLLVEYGANVNHRAIYDSTPLKHAVNGEEYKTALFLLRSGADPTIANSVNGNTAIGGVNFWTEKYARDPSRLAKFPYYDDFVRALKKRGYLDEDF